MLPEGHIIILLQFEYFHNLFISIALNVNQINSICSILCNLDMPTAVVYNNATDVTFEFFCELFQKQIYQMTVDQFLIIKLNYYHTYSVVRSNEYSYIYRCNVVCMDTPVIYFVPSHPKMFVVTLFLIRTALRFQCRLFSFFLP